MRWTATRQGGCALAPPLDSRRPSVASCLCCRLYSSAASSCALGSGAARQLCAGAAFVLAPPSTQRAASRRSDADNAEGLVQRLAQPRPRTKFNLTKLIHLLLTYIACSQQTLGRATTAGSAPNPGNLYGIQTLGHAIAAWLRAKPGQPVRHPPRAPRRPLPPQTVLSGERRGPRWSPWREDLVVAPASARPEL